MTEEAKKKEVEAEEVSDQYVEDLIITLSSDIEKSHESLERTRKRCYAEEISDLEFELENKRRRLEKLNTSRCLQKLLGS